MHLLTGHVNGLEFRRGKKKITKGNVDAELVLHTMIQWSSFDKAIIISGDGDLQIKLLVFKYLKNR